jgi:hypothetical protein
MKRFTNTRRRKVASFTVALVLLGVTSAAAYFLVLTNGAGSGSNTLGTGSNTETITLKASFAAGLLPGKHENLTITAVNNTAHASDIRFMTVTPSIDGGHAGCSPSFFKVTPGSSNIWEAMTTGSGLTEPKAIAVGEELTFTPQLAFADDGTNQNACEGATLTLNLTSTP